MDFKSQIKSTVATGTAPLNVASTTVVANLNADLLDGNHASAFLTTSGNAASATKLQTARSISLSTGVVSTATNFDGTSNISIPVTEISEAYLTWGGKSLSGTYAPIDAAMVPVLGANRFAFTNPAAIIVEYSKDNGATWIDYGTSDANKINLLCGNSGNIQVGGEGYSAGTDYTGYQVRLIINTSAGSIYTILNKFIIYLSTNGSTGAWCTIDARLQSNYTGGIDTWTTFANKVPVGGWSGYNVINTSGITTYGNTPASQYGQVRFTFGQTGYNVSYTGLQVMKILGFGGVGWITPSTLAETGLIYRYDYNKNVTFPANITSTGFVTTIADTTGTASHYYVETSSDGVVRPKPLSNVRTEIVTTAAVNAAAATTVGTITSGVWNGTAIAVANGGTGATTAAAALTNLGVTATAAELNKLNGATATTAELNFVTGVTSAIQTQLNAKAPLASPSLTGTPVAPTAAVGTNTTQLATTAFVNAEIANDAAPKVHTHTIANITDLGTTLNNYQLRSEKGQANGYASLGADGLVPSTQLPSYVDDVLEFANFAALPATGEPGKIYIALDTNKTYRWSGSVYVYITSGAVDSVAGKTGVVSLVKSDVGLSNVDNTADLVKSVASAATLTTARTINGTSFNGSENITTTNWGTSRTITIGSTGKEVNGSGNVSWSLAEIGAQAAGSYAASTHTHGNITNTGAIGTTAGLMVKTTTSGVLTTLAAGTTSQYLRGDGTWSTPISSEGSSEYSQEFTATEGQTLFTLSSGSYTPGNSRLTIFIWGLRQHNTAFTETSSTSFTLSAGVPAGTKVLAVWRVADPILKGDTGTAATVAVGTTTTGAAGTNASVTNSGTSSAAVLNFTIPRGNTGATGSAATIAVGAVTTLAPGSTATVTNVGTTGAAVFNFGIPQGTSGASAANAVTVADTGAYYTGTNVEAVLQEIGVALSNASGAAVDISITDAGSYFAATNVEAALAEVATTKAPIASPTFTGTVSVATRIDFGTAASIVYNSTTKSFDFIINE